jgi:hypothetical protein
MLWLGQNNPEKRVLSYLLCAPMLMIVARYAWVGYHTPTEEDALDNYSRNPEYCGRCAYSLTGNITGACPECGWTIPTAPLLIESSDWSAWWRKWRIDYVRHWRWHLFSYAVFAIFFFITAAYFLSQEKTGGAAVMAIMAVHFSINTFRVASYVLRSWSISSTSTS